MRVFVDASGSMAMSYEAGHQGRELLDWIAKYSDGIAVVFDQKIRSKQLFSTTEKIKVTSFCGGSDPNCLGGGLLCVGNELKVLLTDGLHPPITYPMKNVLTIDPSSNFKPSTLALHMSMIDTALKNLDSDETSRIALTTSSDL